MKRFSIIVVGLALITALIVGGLVGYTIRAATIDYNNINQYCYEVGTWHYVPASGDPNTQQVTGPYRVTCSSQPLPQTP